MDKIKTLKEFESLEYTTEALFERHGLKLWYDQLRELGFDRDLRADIEITLRGYAEILHIDLYIRQTILDNSLAGVIYTNNYSKSFYNLSLKSMLQEIDTTIYYITNKIV